MYVASAREGQRVVPKSPPGSRSARRPSRLRPDCVREPASRECFRISKWGRHFTRRGKHMDSGCQCPTKVDGDPAAPVCLGIVHGRCLVTKNIPAQAPRPQKAARNVCLLPECCARPTRLGAHRSSPVGLARCPRCRPAFAPCSRHTFFPGAASPPAEFLPRGGLCPGCNADSLSEVTLSASSVGYLRRRVARGGCRLSRRAERGWCIK